MILYTTMPQELMFHQEEDYEKQTTVEMNGISMLVEQTSPTECKIVRLLSTDPNHFLNEAYSPGQTITLKPEVK